MSGTDSDTMVKYPIFLKLSGRRVVLIGAGAVAARKAQSLLASGAHLVIAAETVDDMLTDVCRNANVELIKSRYSKDYLSGATLVIAATNDNELNEQIYKDCQELGLLCNVVDVPQLCDFFIPAVAKRGNLQIAIGTDGDCPAYAKHLRKKLERMFTDKHSEFLTELRTIRELIIETVPDIADRKVLLQQLVEDESFEYFVDNGPQVWRAYATEIIESKKYFF